MPVRKKKAPAPPAPVARRTARRHKPSRRSLDSGLFNTLVPVTAIMHAHQEPEEPQNPPLKRAKRSSVHSQDADAGRDADKRDAPRPRKRPRTAVPSVASHDSKGGICSSPRKPRSHLSSRDVPILRLWDEHSMKVRPGLLRLRDLFEALDGDEYVSLYVGQSNDDFPDNLCGSMISREDVTRWRQDLEKPGQQRRVMIFNPVDLAIVAYDKSPHVRDLEDFIVNTDQGSPDKQPRVYAAEHTSFHGLSDDVRHYVKRISQRHSFPRDSAPATSENIGNGPENETRGVDCHIFSPRYPRREKACSVNEPLSFNDRKTDSVGRVRERENAVSSQELDVSKSSTKPMQDDELCPFHGEDRHDKCEDDDDIAMRSKDPYCDIFESNGDVAEHGLCRMLPPFQGVIALPIKMTTDSSASEPDFGADTSIGDPALSSGYRANSMAMDRDWTIFEESSSSDDSLLQNVTGYSPEEMNGEEGERYAFQEEVLDGSGMVPEPSKLDTSGVDHGASSAKIEEKDNFPGLSRLDTAATRHKKLTQSRSGLPKHVQEGKLASVGKLPFTSGRKGFRTNPVGPEEGPVESSPYSTHVYIWNYGEKTRSDLLMPLADAIEACRRYKRPAFGIYDGQDYDFKSGRLSWKIHIFDYDLDKWTQRKKGGDHKVRVWNRSQRSFRAYQFCPTLSGLMVWLTQHQDLSIFQPPLIDPTFSAQSQAPNTPLLHCLSLSTPRSSTVFWNRLLRRLRQVGVTEVRAATLRNVEFWNAAKRCKEKRKPFETRAELARFLFGNPWIELYRNQDEVEEFELSSGFRLMPIFTNCPAEIACFWDNRSRKKYIQPKDVPEFQGRTIYDCLSSNDALELYLGQDTTCFTALSNAVANAQRSGSYPYRYMLAYSGHQAREFLSQSWAAVYIDVSRRSTACAVFWKKDEGALQMQPDLASFVSIEHYLERHANSTELYTGQDLAVGVIDDLSKWFRVMMYRPGYSPSSQRPMLTKLSFLPVPGVLRDGLDDSHFRPCSGGEAPNGHIKPKNALPSSDAGVESVQLNAQRGNERRSLSKRILTSTGGVDTRSSSNKEPLPGAPPSTMKERRAEPSLDTTNCSDDNHDGSTEDPSSQTPDSSLLHDQDAYQDSIGSDLLRDERDGDLQAGACNDTSGTAFVEVPLSRTSEGANKISNLIKEAGPKILNKQLKQDIRQTLREDLLLDVDSSNTLLRLALRFRAPEFVSVAGDLCTRLEALDVHNCFSNIAQFGYGPPDLLSMRTDLESGKIYTIAGVVKKFRLICGDLMQFHQSGALFNEANLLKHYGEEIIAEFITDNRKLVLEEERISRIARICEKARKIGFQEDEARRKARRSSSLKSPVKSKPSIRVPGYLSEVTFLNYRDEKGYSVMGKRHSARVFGLSIDRRTCEAQADNIRPCHVCEREIFRSDGDALQCANHTMGLCEEVVCRSCLESVFSVNEKEFSEWRILDDWICVHCRGLCVRKGAGEPSRCSLSDEGRTLPDADVQFVWPHDTKRASFLSIKVAMKSIGGAFESLEDGKTVNLEREGSESAWSGTAKLPVGAYRCSVNIDGIWAFSTTFQVLPSISHRTGRNTPGRPATSPLSETRRSGHCAENAPAAGQQQIEWKLAKYTRKDPGPVHSFSQTNGGAFVEKCSRTEGYDWRRSKRHAVVQWIPEKSGIEAEPCDSEERQVQVLRLSASTQRVSSTFQRSDFRKLEVGMSWRQFKQALNAFKFDYMRNETLWGIVTGTSRIHGIGLFTLTGYEKGDFVIEYAGDLIRTPLGDIREKRYEAEGLGTYLFKIDEYQIVDATVKSNRARFTNHSCDPNMSAKIVNVRGRDLVVLLATRNIPPFAELTFNYQLPYEDKKLECLCSSWNCVGVMN